MTVTVPEQPKPRLVPTTALASVLAVAGSTLLHAEEPRARLEGPPTSTKEEAVIEAEIFRRVNDARAGPGRARLVRDNELDRAAKDFSRRMRTEDFFSHVAPEGETLTERLGDFGEEFDTIGENIFKSVNAARPAEAAVTGWMKSTSHHENMLSPDFEITGIGVSCGHETCLYTQLFAGRG